MFIKETMNHFVTNTRQAIIDVKNDITFAIDKFAEAPGKEKAWVIFKTVLAAVGAGIITLGATALIGGPSIIVTTLTTGFTALYALYRFARSSRSPTELMVNQGVNDVRNTLNEARRTVTNLIDRTSNQIDQALQPKSNHSN